MKYIHEIHLNRLYKLCHHNDSCKLPSDCSNDVLFGTVNEVGQASGQSNAQEFTQEDNKSNDHQRCGTNIHKEVNIIITKPGDAA